jgi:hypothetical protein
MRHDTSPALSFGFEHRQNFISTEGTITPAGIDYSLNAGRKVYLRQGYGQFAGRTETKTAIGVEAAVTPSTTVFNEYRLSSGIDGRSSHRSIGLCNNFSIANNVAGNLSVEHLDTLSGDERQNCPDAFAAALALEYLPRERFKITSRMNIGNKAVNHPTLPNLEQHACSTRTTHCSSGDSVKCEVYPENWTVPFYESI